MDHDGWKGKIVDALDASKAALVTQQLLGAKDTLEQTARVDAHFANLHHLMTSQVRLQCVRGRC